MIKEIKKFVIKNKIYIQRANTYASIARSGMLLFLVFNTLEDYKIDIDIKTYGIQIFIVSYLVLILIGYLDEKTRFWDEELKQTTLRNPVFIKMQKDLEEIKEKLGELNGK